MAKQSFSIGQVLEAADMTQLQANDYNWTVSTKTGNYTLVAADKGTRVVMNSASAQTITVDNAVFDAGDVVWIHNINTGTCTVTAGTATVNTAGSLALAQWEGGVLYFTSAASAIFFRGGGTGYGVATGGSSSSITVGGINYTLLTFTSSGTLTVTKAGLFDVIVVGGGGGSGTYVNGTLGGGAGGLAISTVYLTANQTVTVGAGGTAGASYSTYGRQGNESLIGSANTGISAPGSSSANDDSSGRTVGTGGSMGAGVGTSASIAGVSTLYGNSGGYTVSGTLSNAGPGGGGAGAVGGNVLSNGAGGNGGIGYDASAFRGESATTTYYAGGGAGGGTVSNGTGGSGGGGTAGAGTANTGGGGGGAGATAYNGGSGIVLVRFKV